jgi:hypothetical protein
VGGWVSSLAPRLRIRATIPAMAAPSAAKPNHFFFEPAMSAPPVSWHSANPDYLTAQEVGETPLAIQPDHAVDLIGHRRAEPSQRDFGLEDSHEPSRPFASRTRTCGPMLSNNPRQSNHPETVTFRGPGQVTGFVHPQRIEPRHLHPALAGSPKHTIVT